MSGRGNSERRMGGITAKNKQLLNRFKDFDKYAEDN